MATLDKANTVAERAGKGIIYTYTFTNADTTTAGTTQTLDTGIPTGAGDLVELLSVHTETAWATISTLTANIGVSTAPASSTDVLADGVDIFAANSGCGQGSGTNGVGYLLGAATADTVDVALTADANLDTATGGKTRVVVKVTPLTTDS